MRSARVLSRHEGGGSQGDSVPGSAGHVLVVSASIGAGHDAAAGELVRRLHAAGVPASRRDYLDAVPRPLRWLLRRGYPLAVGYAPWFFDWLFHGVDGTGWVHAVVLALCRLARRRVGRWAADASVVVSTYMMASQTLGQLKERGRLAVPVVTFVPDPAVHRLWIHDRVEYHYGITVHGAEQAERRFGTTVRVTPPLVDPTFAAAAAPRRREALRRELGLPARGPVVLLAAGSLGLGAVPGTVAAIQEAGFPRVVVLCGRNRRLRHRLANRAGVVALGWRDDVAELMGAADVLVHNAGGVSLSEALSAGLPAVTFRPLPGHGHANAAVLARAGLVPWAEDVPGLAAAVRLGLRSPRCGTYSPDTSSERNLTELVLALARRRPRMPWHEPSVPPAPGFVEPRRSPPRRAPGPR